MQDFELATDVTLQCLGEILKLQTISLGSTLWLVFSTTRKVGRSVVVRLPSVTVMALIA
jgi:hypothetical protein